jgi:hypothetical protein
MAMTKQEWLDHMVQTSLQGGYPAFDRATGECQYLTVDGQRCPVGGLFPPECKIPDDLNGLKVSVLLEKHPEFSQYVPEGVDTNDLLSAQWAHDFTAGYPWDHTKFLERLLKDVPCFKGMRPTA